MAGKETRLDPVREAQVVASLLASIRDSSDGDDELVADMIEGETRFFEIVDAVLARMEENRAYAVGIDSVVADLEARKARFAKRREADRTLLEQALMLADLQKIERPAATLFLSARKPKAVVEEEADIPADFWKPGKPTLDKTALLSALQEGQAVPGARLDNAPPSLTVRTK